MKQEAQPAHGDARTDGTHRGDAGRQEAHTAADERSASPVVDGDGALGGGGEGDPGHAGGEADDLLMALSWRLERLARGFGHHETTSGLTRDTLRQTQNAAVGGADDLGCVRLSAPYPGACETPDLPSGGLMPPPQSLECGDGPRVSHSRCCNRLPGPAYPFGGCRSVQMSADLASSPRFWSAVQDLGFELEDLGAELQEHARRPLGTLVGALTPVSCHFGWPDGSPPHGLPPAALVMVQDRWEEEAGRRAQRVRSDRDDLILRSSGGGWLGPPGGPAASLPAAGPTGEQLVSPTRHCWDMQASAAEETAAAARGWWPDGHSRFGE